MEDLKTFISAISQIAEEKVIPKEKVIEIIEMALSAAYKKEYGQKGQNIRAKLNPETGKVKFSKIRMVVDETMLKEEEPEEEREEIKESPDSKKGAEVKGKEVKETSAEVNAEGQEGEKKIRFNEERHIMIGEAKKIKADAVIGDELEFDLETHEDFGRISAQTAKQVIIQRLREAERDAILGEFKSKEGEIVSGIIQRIEGKTIYIDLGRTVGILLPQEQIPREFYRIGQRLRFFVMKVDTGIKEPTVLLSRAYPKFLTKLFEMEVPEVASETVQIKSIAREPGSRSKVAVASIDEKIDPIGSMVGQKGSRISTVINELGGEKIDIIEWSEKPEKFIANSLSPAKVLEVKTSKKANLAEVLVSEDQVSLAIGREGQNVRLAVKLTGWKIDIRSAAKPEESALPEEITKTIESEAAESVEKEEGEKKEAALGIENSESQSEISEQKIKDEKKKAVKKKKPRKNKRKIKKANKNLAIKKSINLPPTFINFVYILTSY